MVFLFPPLLIEAVYLILLDLSGVADDRCEIKAVIIDADVAFLYGNTFQISRILIDLSHGLLAYIGGHCSGLILLKFRQLHGIDNVDHI